MRRLSLSFKVMAGLVCLYAALSGKYPPAHAQTPPAQPTDTIQMPQSFAISPYDPMFKANIDGLKDLTNKMEVHLEASDSRRESLEREVQAMQNDQKWYFWILCALLSGSIAIPGLRGTKLAALIEKLPKVGNEE